MNWKITCVAMVCSACVALTAEDMVKSFDLSSLTLPPGTVTAKKYISDVQVVGAEAHLDAQDQKPHVLIRLHTAGEVHGVIELTAEESTQEKLPEPLLAVLPPAAAPPKPVYVPFTIPAAAFTAAPDGSAHMLASEQALYASMLGGRTNGGLLPETVDLGSRAWWSMRLRQIQPDGTKAGESPLRRGRTDALDDSIDFFTGLTALDENLQFERRLMVAGPGTASVALSSLPELEVRAIPWNRMPAAPAAGTLVVDLLAQRIPANQYAVLFPSFTALVTSIAQADSALSGPLQLIAGHGEDSGMVGRYQHQLGLELTELSKRFGADVIDQVAVTGSDPFLRMGSDLAIILHAKQPALLASYLALRQQALVSAGGIPSAGTSGSTAWNAVINADRSLCRYVASDGDITLVTNSLSQIAAFDALRAHPDLALSKAPEYAFFRRRYALDARELALAVVSDAALRQWCSARCRIGDSRRSRAQTVLANLQAEWIAAGCPATWAPENPPTDLGAITVTADGVRSAIYGSLGFLTPISELQIDQVTPEEAAAFKRFIEHYQQSWRDYFDPIAIHLESTATGALAVDLSVLPLIVSSEYRQMLQLTGTTTLARGIGDPHAALLQLALALDRTSTLLTEAEHSFGALAGGLASPLGWIGTGASIYLDPDPVWDEMNQPMPMEQHYAWLTHNISRIPIGLNIAVSDQLKLAAFLAGLKVLVEQSAPGMLVWSSRTWKNITYVVVSPSEAGRNDIPTDLYYLPAAEGLTVTIHEGVMKHAIERLISRRAAAAAPAPAADAHPWAGEQVSAFAQPTFLAHLSDMDQSSGISTWMWSHMWHDVAILNEWHRLFPGQDPLATHERLWKTRLVCPFGGTYHWNEAHLSMEPTAVDLTSADLSGAVPAAMAAIASIRAGIGFEELPALSPHAEPAPAGVRAGQIADRNRVSIGLRARIEIVPAGTK